MSINDELYDAIVFGERDKVVEIVQLSVDAGDNVVELLNTTMIPALREVGDQFSRGEVFVPEMLVSARAMQAGVDIIEPLLVSSGHEPIARVCIGSVKGDLHDIGKNLVVTMLRGVGFEVRDLGVSVARERFCEEVEAYQPDVLGLSALLTTTMVEMGEVIKALETRALRGRCRVIVGGAPVSEQFAAKIGADGYAANAVEAVRLAKRLVSEGVTARREGRAR